MVMQWHDKRNVIMLSTIHTGQMMDTGRTRHGTEDPILKPDLVLDYNDNIRLVDKANMIVSFLHCARKTVIWHHNSAGLKGGATGAIVPGPPQEGGPHKIYYIKL